MRVYANKFTLRPPPNTTTFPVNPIDVILVDADPNGNESGAPGDLAYLAGGTTQWRCTGGTTWVVTGDTGAGGLTYLVGPTGSGAPYTSIQNAIDAAVAAGASQTQPEVILILVGTYVEDIIVPAGVRLQGFPLLPLGGPIILGTGGLAPVVTFNVTAPLPAPPSFANPGGMRGLTILNPTAGGTALYVTGAASNSITLVGDCFLGGSGAGVLLLFDVVGSSAQLIMENVPVIGDGAAGSIGIRMITGQLLKSNSVITADTALHLATGTSGICSQILTQQSGPVGGDIQIDAGSGGSLFTDLVLGGEMIVDGNCQIGDMRALSSATPIFTGTGQISVMGDVAYIGGGGGFAGTLTVIRLPADGTFNKSSTDKTFVDSPYTATGLEGIIGYDPTGGASIVNLPPLADVRGQSITVVHSSASANGVAVAPNGAETIFGGPGVSLSSFTSRTFYAPASGTDWWITATG